MPSSSAVKAEPSASGSGSSSRKKSSRSGSSGQLTTLEKRIYHAAKDQRDQVSHSCCEGCLVTISVISLSPTDPHQSKASRVT